MDLGLRVEGENLLLEKLRPSNKTLFLSEDIGKHFLQIGPDEILRAIDTRYPVIAALGYCLAQLVLNEIDPQLMKLFFPKKTIREKVFGR